MAGDEFLDLKLNTWSRNTFQPWGEALNALAFYLFARKIHDQIRDIFLMMLGMSRTSNNLSANLYTGAVSAKKISISVSHQAGDGIPGSYQMTIKSDDNSFYSQNSKEKQALTVPEKTLLELVNDFYKIHFFNYQKLTPLKSRSCIRTILL
ncbi:MAG: hypothetical protein PHG00_17600 [Methylococcales bacterium]|nr:hypothetical protein [Methylococcales bacterium]